MDGCLEALRQAETGISWEVVAVMNDASPESRAVLAQLQDADLRILAVWPGENVQFALGCNSLVFGAVRRSPSSGYTLAMRQSLMRRCTVLW